MDTTSTLVPNPIIDTPVSSERKVAGGTERPQSWTLTASRLEEKFSEASLADDSVVSVETKQEWRPANGVRRNFYTWEIFGPRPPAKQASGLTLQYIAVGCEPVQLAGRDRWIHSPSTDGHRERSLPSWDSELTRDFNSLVQAQNEAEDSLLNSGSFNLTSAHEHLFEIEEKYRLYINAHLDHLETHSWTSGQRWKLNANAGRTPG